MALVHVTAPRTETSEEARAHLRLWDAHARTIHRFCFRRTADAALADDLTSIVFLEAWRRRRDLSGTAEELLPWLYGVATNVLRNQRRSQRRHQAALTRLPPPLAEPDFADASTDRLDDELRMRGVLERLAKLSRLEQEVLSLCIWEELTTQAAAAALGVPEATVRTRLRRAREHLRLFTEAAAQGEHP
jgi:RNA polymerase sigma-70 factor (ECF subfamily)